MGPGHFKQEQTGGCPYKPGSSENPLRQDLETLPDRMKDLPVDRRGYVVPWFVDWLPNGEPEFRAMDLQKFVRACNYRLCWVCGKKLGTYLTFVAGPMCGINRTSSEPPSHRECARWSARNCPFLSRPRMVRREDGMEDAQSQAGLGIKRNPGVTLLWTTKSYSIFDDGKGGKLCRMGDPTEVEWWTEKRPSSREEVEYSVDTGLPFLEEAARGDKRPREALEQLARMVAYFRRNFLPGGLRCP